MNGNTLRSLRKEKSWSQQRLAEVAGVSVRTIQRAERSGHCSDESALRISTALSVDVQVLRTGSQAVSTGPREDSRQNSRQDSRTVRRLLGGEISAGLASAVGALLSLPAVAFIAANILKYELGVPALYDSLVKAGSLAPNLSSILVHPIVLIGFPILAVALVLVSQVRVWGETDTDERRISIFGVDLLPNVGGVAIVALAVTCLLILSGYVVIENLGHFVADVVNAR